MHGQKKHQIMQRHLFVTCCAWVVALSCWGTAPYCILPASRTRELPHAVVVAYRSGRSSWLLFLDARFARERLSSLNTDSITFLAT